MRISTRLADAAIRLGEVSDSGRLDAELLLAHVLQETRTWLFVHAGDELDAADAQAFEELLARRLDHEPVAYIIGHKEFWSVPLTVTPATLVPRPETERLVEIALDHIPENDAVRIADLGTGSGAIAIAIALERPHAHITACDISGDALTVAAQNILSLNLSNIDCIESDWVTDLIGKPFDLVVSNPPYVESDSPLLTDLVKEPRNALTAGQDGLDSIRQLTTEVRKILKINGCFVFEHGANQAAQVRSILEAAGWREIHNHRDYAGLPRVTTAIFRG